MRREWIARDSVRVKDEVTVRLRVDSETGWSHEQEGLREGVRGFEGPKLCYVRS